jgi:hypothetical protein
MPTKAINLRKGEIIGTTICDTTGCMGLHYMNQCFTFNEGPELNTLIRARVEKSMHKTTIQKFKDNTTKLCNALCKLDRMVKNDQTPVKMVFKQIKHIVKTFGGTDPKLKMTYHSGCLQILRQRKGFAVIRKHKIPEFNSPTEILSAIANWRIDPWIAKNLHSLCLKAYKVYKCTEKQIESALNIGEKIESIN